MSVEFQMPTVTHEARALLFQDLLNDTEQRLSWVSEKEYKTLFDRILAELDEDIPEEERENVHLPDAAEFMVTVELLFQRYPYLNQFLPVSHEGTLYIPHELITRWTQLSQEKAEFYLQYFFGENALNFSFQTPDPLEVN